MTETSWTVCLVVILSLSCCSPALSENYYITVNSTDPCPCLNISQFSQLLLSDSLDHNDTNLVLTFQSGNHTLEGLGPLKFEGFTNVSLVAESSNVTVFCDNDTYFVFIAIGEHKVYVMGIQFIGCHGNMVTNVETFVLQQSSFIGQNHIAAKRALTLNHTVAYILRSVFKRNRCVLQDFYIKFCEFCGAIFVNKSRIEINDSTFDGNGANSGGAICSAEQSTLIIDNSNFVNNVAHLLYAFFMNILGGGTIHATDTTVNITASIFTNNTAYNGGGVIWIRNDNNGTVTIKDSNFTMNTAMEGGVMTSSTSYTTVNITGSNFINNTAIRNGGALNFYFTLNTFINIETCRFVQNSGQNGGALFIKDGHTFGYFQPSINISNCEFVQNKATERGGVFHTRAVQCHMHLTESVLTDNAAGRQGGVIYTRRCLLDIRKCQFQTNSAGNDGGVVSADTREISITESNFTRNGVDRNGHGGVLHVLRSILTARHNTFTSNMASFGGVLWLQDVKMESHNITAQDNRADIDGGVFHSGRSNISIKRATFSGNRADYNGGFMYTSRDVIVFD